MKTSLIIVTIILSIVLAYVGILCYGSSLSMLLPRIENVRYSSGSAGHMADMLWFGLLCGLIPIVVVLSWIVTKTTDYKWRLISVLLILVCVVAAVAIRYYFVSTFANMGSQLVGDVEYIIDFNELKYNQYFFFGEVAGFLIAFTVLRYRPARNVVAEDILDA